ncbi:CPBP family intramembrane glutamic endopeptidase [Ktedonobacter racemifer]|uniref:Abortive infection protein n=1 Tax=Ktedonobacter racemifer DSM 44963 TaxID=485913 RepID=D6TKP9_KTERA|nr:CPBP family intramembrane glutamic endopeptidase [Ktedonobacter racemifer]EFH86349.1 Abortive infection protein [Ktedonobacter racemifer DSM 44963]
MSNAKSTQLVRSTVATSWRWMWPDLLMRIIPMSLVPLLYIAFFHLPLSFLGLTLTHVPLHLLVGLLVGIGMAIFAIFYRMNVVGPWFRWPTASDQCFQSFFYLFINAPVEELFFRGFLLAIVTQWTGWLGWGWLVSTAVYTLYHRLGKWNWRSVGGVGLAGIVFSLVYLLLPGPHSLLAVTLVHGFTTSGFLSWGDEALYRTWKHRLARAEAVQE